MTSKFILKNSTALLLIAPFLISPSWGMTSNNNGDEETKRTYARIQCLWHLGNSESRKASIELLQGKELKGEDKKTALIKHLKRLGEYLSENPSYRPENIISKVHQLFNSNAITKDEIQIKIDELFEEDIKNIYSQLINGNPASKEILSPEEKFEETKIKFYFNRFLKRFGKESKDLEVEIEANLDALMLENIDTLLLYRIQYFRYCAQLFDTSQNEIPKTKPLANLERLYEKTLHASNKNQSSQFGHVAIRIARKLAKYDPPDFNKVLSRKQVYYSTAALLGDPASLYQLAQLSEMNEGTDVHNLDIATESYTEAGQKKYPLAAHKIAISAEEGNSKLRIKRDEKVAFKWHKTAAHYGHPDSQYWIYRLHCEGKSIDNIDPIEMLHLSAEAGHAAAQKDLGERYRTGNGVVKSEDKAFYWCHKSALQGNLSAYFSVGWSYEKGIGVGKDFGEAYRWYWKAHSVFAKDSDIQDKSQKHKVRYRLGKLYEKGLGVFKKDAKSARDFYELSANGGNPSAKCRAAGIYLYGDDGIPQDLKKAYEFLSASDQGNFKVLTGLGIMNQFGLGTPQNHLAAVSFLKQAVDKIPLHKKNHSIAIIAKENLAYLYDKGWGCEKNTSSQALPLWEETAALRSDVGAYRAGKYYLKQWAINKDNLSAEKARQYLRQAAEVEEPHGASALYYLGMMEEKDVAKNPQTSNDNTVSREMRCYKESAEKGNAAAQFKMGCSYETLARIASTQPSGATQLAKKEEILPQKTVPVPVQTEVKKEAPQVDEALLKTAFEWYEKASSCNWHALMAMGRMYKEGHGTQKDPQKAFQCFEKARSVPNLLCLSEIKSLADQGQEDALGWFEKEAAAGNSDALYYLGQRNEEGKHLKQDMLEVIDLYSCAFDKRKSSAYLRLQELKKVGLFKILKINSNQGNQ